MKKLFALSLLTIMAFAIDNVYAQSCCQKMNGMQTLALNKKFKASHEAPLPLNYTPEKGSMIQFPTTQSKDGISFGNAFYVPAKGNSDKVLLIFHEWWGLNDYIKREAERWEDLLGGNVAIYAVDLYDGKVAVTADEAGKLMSTMEPQRGEAIITGLLEKIGKGKKITTLGWCMGGSWSFTGAVLAGSDAAGCVMYYGFPEKNPNRIKSLRCDVLYMRASQDNFIKQGDVDDFGQKVKNAGHGFDLHAFDAVHAFANPSNPKYDVKAATEAQGISLKFLKGKLAIE